MPIATALTTAALLAAPALPARPQDEPPAAEDPARALFLAHCATCHGETGDGDGVTELDRPARSFRAGGFSFGNTPEAVFRTLTSGIPGSPMPSFERALSEGERRLVAAYVLSLGPEEPPAPPADSELVVRERPLVVRGMLPAIAAGAREHPRGLLIGLTGGLSAEYRTDDVRLVGVRQGRFVERTDWVGRGGSALRPLGQVVFLNEGGDPAPVFELAPAAGVGRGGALSPLRARMRGSWVRGERAGLTYLLEAQDGRAIATVEESVRSLATSVGAGFARRFVVTAGAEPATLALRSFFPDRGAGEALDEGVFSGAVRGEPGTLECGQVRYSAIEEHAGLCRIAALASAPWIDARRLEVGPRAVLTLTPGERAVLEDALLFTRDWALETRATVARELFP